MGNLLFNPNGRIGKSEFWQGLIVLLVIAAIFQVLAVYVNPMMGLILYPLIFCYVCVFGKRLHDAGNSAWLYLLFLLGYVVLSFVLSLVLTPILAPEVAEFQREMTEEIAESGSFDMGAIMEMSSEVGRMTLIPNLVALIISHLILGFIAAALKSDPTANQYGEPTFN